MERLCVNAKNIDVSAFAGMESLKEIHIRGGVEHMSLGAFAMLPSIETICLEGIDPDVMEDDWANLGNSNLTILVPEDTSDEQLEAIGRKFLSSMIITDGAQVKRGTCSMPRIRCRISLRCSVHMESDLNLKHRNGRRSGDHFKFDG